jgi:hypothetical protein
MRFLRPYFFLFESPRWQSSLLQQSLSLLVGSLVPIISVIGAWPILGYYTQFARQLASRDDEPKLPPFELNRLGDYFRTGGWPFLYYGTVFVIWLAIYIVMYIAMLIILHSSGPPSRTSLILNLAGWSLSLMVLYYALSLISWPFVIHGLLTGRFAPSEAYAFAGQFFRLVGGSMIAILLPKIVLDTVLFTVGMLACCIGLYPAWAVFMGAELHFQMQLYRKFLARGGDPVGGSDLILIDDSPIPPDDGTPARNTPGADS